MGSAWIGLTLAADPPPLRDAFHVIWPIFFWVFTGIFLLFGVLFPVLMFLGALLSKQRIAPLELATEEERSRRKVPPSVEAAMSMDYRPLGLYAIGEAGTKRRFSFLLLSPDGNVLMQTGAGKKYALMSRLQSGLWVVTADTLPTLDLTGLQSEEMLPGAPLGTVAYYHRQRVGQSGQECVPFVPEDAPAELQEHDRQCANMLKELGLARYVGVTDDVWRFTVRGAFKMAWQLPRMMKKMQEGKKRIEVLKEEMRLVAAGK